MIDGSGPRHAPGRIPPRRRLATTASWLPRIRHKVAFRWWFEGMSVDEAFACPDCGTTVEIKGLAPGRQVRCGFCHRLLEVPYFRRVAEPRWKRRRFERPWWVFWAWWGLGLLGFLILVIAAGRFLDRQSHITLDRTIDRLVASSQSQEEAGNRDRAVVELDSAINLCPPDSTEHRELLDQLRSRRQALVRRGAADVLERLRQNESRPFPLGEWLNLQARVATDPDLALLRGEVAVEAADETQAMRRNRSRGGPKRRREWRCGHGLRSLREHRSVGGSLAGA